MKLVRYYWNYQDIWFTVSLRIFSCYCTEGKFADISVQKVESLNRIKVVAISWAYLILPQQVTCSHNQWWRFSLNKMFWHCLLELEGWGVAKAQQPFHLPISWERNVTEIRNWSSPRICPAWWQEGGRGVRRHFYNSGPSPLIRSQPQIVRVQPGPVFHSYLYMSLLETTNHGIKCRINEVDLNDREKNRDLRVL